jgi:hypothetical protein
MIEFRVFVSSPGDVRDERWIAGRVLDRLAHKWGRRVHVDPVFWEHEPLAADATYQVQITPPDQCDVVVAILWSRLGTRLPADIIRPDPKRRHYESGTEYELEVALAAHRAYDRPEVLVYRKSKQALAKLTNQEEVNELLRQKQALDETIERLFTNPDGSAKGAILSFEEPERFGEVLHKHLEALIVRRIEEEEAREGGEGEGAVASVRTSLWQGSPFRGLSVFQPEDAAIFCGRSVRVRQILDALRVQELSGRPFVVVVGASGSGKSSLVRAGVLPRLMVPGSVGEVAFWRRAMWIPGTSAAPFEGLASALLAEGALPELAASGTVAADLAAELRERPGAAVSRLRMGLANAAGAERRRAGMDDGTVSTSEVGLVLLVDQAEELFSAPTIGPDDVKRLDAALATLAGSGLVRILATLRSDFYDRFAALPELMRLKEGAGQYDLPAPDPEEIARMIREPAEIAGLRWEREPESGRQLDDVVRDDAVADPGALPLLEFTLDELYRRSEDGRLTFAAYRALGGIEGALAHRADQVFGSLSAEARSAFDPVLLALVRPSPDPEAPPSRRRAPRADFDAVPGGGELVDTFVRERLLTVDRGDDGGARVSVAHEALLRAWPRAVDWRERHAGQLATRARVESQTATWTAEAEDPGFLLPAGTLLDDARALLATPGAPLGPTEARLVRASAEAAAERRRKGVLRKKLVAAAIVVVALGALLVWDLFYREHVKRYSAITWRDGVPRGVGQVEEPSSRWWSYAVATRGRLGRVERVAAIDGRGDPTYWHDFQGFLSRAQTGISLDLTAPRQTIGRECVWEIDYENRRVSRLRALDRAGAPVYELEYKGRSGSSGRELTAEYSLDGVAVPQAESGAAVVKSVWREDDGFLESVWFLDATGQRRPDRNLSWGVRIEEVDESGLPRQMTNLGHDGQPAPNRDGWIRAKARWEDGRLVRADFSDGEGRPVLTRGGYARLERTYDESGNPTEERYFDEQGSAMSGVAVSRLRFGDGGRLESVSYENSRGRPTVDPGGLYGAILEYDDSGELARIFAAGPTGLPVEESPTGYSGLGLTWAERREGETYSRSLAAITYLDADAEPVAIGVTDTSEGFTGEAYKFDDRGNLIEIRYLDKDGKTVPVLGGPAKVLKQYDGRGRMVRRIYKDPRNLPSADIAGCSEWELSYDAHGNPTERHCFDRDGEPTVGKLGAVWVTDYNDSGLPEADRFLDLDGAPYPAPLGCWIADLRDEPPGDDIDRLLYLLIGRIQDIVEGRPVSLEPGCSGLDVIYDAVGEVHEVEYFEPREEPVGFEHGCARVQVRHDHRGREIERVCLAGGSDRRTARPGWSRVEVAYDEHGRAGEVYQDPQGRSVAMKSPDVEDLLRLLGTDAPPQPPPPPPQPPGANNRTRNARGVQLPPPPPPPPPPPLPPPVSTARPPADLELKAQEIKSLADRLRGEYDGHLDALLDASDRDKAEGEKRIEGLLEELDDAAGALHDAAEEWTEDWEKPNQMTRIRGKYAAGKADVRRLAGEVAALAGSHPLGPAASATLVEIRRRVSGLP